MYIPRTGIAGSYGSAIFSFLRSFILFYIAVELMYIPTSSVEVYLFPPSSSAFVVCVIDDNHSDWSEVKSQCSFDLHFPYSQGC
jgi:hypothetical protein